MRLHSFLCLMIGWRQVKDISYRLQPSADSLSRKGCLMGNSSVSPMREGKWAHSCNTRGKLQVKQDKAHASKPCERQFVIDLTVVSPAAVHEGGKRTFASNVPRIGLWKVKQTAEELLPLEATLRKGSANVSCVRKAAPALLAPRGRSACWFDLWWTPTCPGRTQKSC